MALMNELPGAVEPSHRVPGAVELRAGTVPAREALVRARTLRLAVGAGLVGFGTMLGLVQADRSARFDLAVTRVLQRHDGASLGRLMRLASWPGFPPQSRVIPPVLIGGWLALGLRVEAICQAAAWGSALLATLVKALTRRPRPVAPQVEVVLAPLGGTSFPSGHVLSYVGTYGFCAFVLGVRVRRPGSRALAVAMPLSLVALVGPSRIQQGHHWFTDVAASYLLGLAYVAALVSVYQRLLARSREP